jgi:PAS domain S-box-containing protein
MAWSVRTDGIVDFVNQRWMDYTGLSLAEESEEPTRPIHPEDVPKIMERWLEERQIGEPYDAELRLRRADGEYRWFLVRTAPLRDEQGNVVKWYGVSIDIEDRKRTEEQLKATTQQVRALSARLESAKEQEGIRIARELHDELGGALSSLKWDLEELVESVSDSTNLPQFDHLTKRIEAMIELTDTTMNVVRRITSELRPIALDELGLSAAVEWQARQFQERTEITVQCDCDQEGVDLTREQSTAVFRIFQEALTNVLRHAQATTVHIQLHKEIDAIILTISDNGRGITEEEKSGQRTLGLLGMRERAHLIGAKITINGSEGKGTVITVRMPISR